MLYVFPKIVKPEICETIINDLITQDLEPATVGSDDFSRDDPRVRKTSVYFVPTDKNKKVNQIVWHYLKEANRAMFNYDLTYFQGLQFAQYQDGGFYDWHIDSYTTNEPNKTRKLSLSLILTDPNTFEGGELEFYNGGRPIEEQNDKTGKQIKKDLKSRGTIVVFDSRDWHRVKPVVKGIRHSIVCWATGADFK